MSKDQFFLMRIEELASQFPATVTKKELVKTGIKNIDDILEDGNIGPHELMSQIIRYKTVFDSMEAQLRDKLPHEKITVMGIDYAPNEGRKMIQYSDDFLWSELNEKLKAREELLKLAEKSKDSIYDHEGIEVPKCSVKYSKSSITITF